MGASFFDVQVTRLGVCEDVVASHSSKRSVRKGSGDDEDADVVVSELKQRSAVKPRRCHNPQRKIH